MESSREMENIDFVSLGALLSRLEDRTAHVVIDQHGIVKVWGTEAEHLFGWTSSEAVGQLLANLVIPTEMQQSHREGLRKWVENIPGLIIDQSYRTRARHKDGHYFMVTVQVQMVKDDSGIKFLGWVSANA
jgi:PAS domain S-box-containing protein